MSKKKRRRADASALSSYRRFNLLRRSAKRSHFKLVGKTIEHQTVYQGLFGASRIWKALSWYVVFRMVARRLFGRQPQRVAAERLRIDQGVTIRLLPPSARSR